MTYSNYEILSKDTVVAKWMNNKLEVLNQDMLPFFLHHNQNADMWLKSRAIDYKRPNSRL